MNRRRFLALTGWAAVCTPLLYTACHNEDLREVELEVRGMT